MPRQPTPEPIIVPIQAVRSIQATTIAASKHPTDLRQLRVDEFLQARSLSKNSQKAYRQDLQRFMNWTDTGWSQATRRQVAQFKAFLLQEKELAPATVNRVLTTLKNFYGWMNDSDHVPKNPTTAVSLLKLEEAEAQDLTQAEVTQIFEVILQGKFPQRDLALVSVLLHGLRAAEAAALNLDDYDGTRFHILKAKSDSKGFVPLKAQARQQVDAYLEWRGGQGEALAGNCPLFLSHSRRSAGQRLSYWGIRDVMERIKEATGIDLNAHRFRHTFATDLVLKGMDTYHIMTLTRHKSMQSFRRYTKRADQIAAEQAFFEAIGEDERCL